MGVVNPVFDIAFYFSFHFISFVGFCEMKQKKERNKTLRYTRLILFKSSTRLIVGLVGFPNVANK